MALASRPELTAIVVETLAAEAGDLVTLAPLMERLEQFSALGDVQKLWDGAWNDEASAPWPISPQPRMCGPSECHG